MSDVRSPVEMNLVYWLLDQELFHFFNQCGAP